MATYKEIQNWVKAEHGFVPKTCWIAHRKAVNGIRTRTAWNRQSSDERQVPCPPDKAKAIDDALRHFGMIA